MTQIGKEKQIIVNEASRKEILCYGDSNTWGYNPFDSGRRYPVAQRWTSVLQHALGNSYHVIAEGMNGRTTVFDDPVEPGRNGLTYLHTCLQSHKPLDIVLVMLGTNDAKHRFALLPVDIALGMKRLVKSILNSETGTDSSSPKVGIIVPVPVCTDLEGGVFTGASQRMSALAEQYRIVADDLHVACFDAGSVIQLSMPDGIHLSRESHAKLGVAIAQWVKDIF